jgi:chaperonin GroES
MQALNDHVIVRLDPPEKIIDGIHLPASAIKKENTGTIVSVGPGRRANGKRIPMDLKAGERIIFATYASSVYEPMVADGHKYATVNEKGILAALS